MNASQLDRLRKDYISTFEKGFGLNITINTNLKVVNFLDVTLDISTGKYQPYNKPNNNPVYINVSSNYPPNILKRIPENIYTRINNISSAETTFKNAAQMYNKALHESGYKTKITYKAKTTPASTTTIQLLPPQRRIQI